MNAKRFLQVALRWNAPVRVKLATAFAALLLPVLALIVANFADRISRSEESITAECMLAADAVGAQIEETFDAAIGTAWAIANDPIVQSLDAARLDAHLTRLAARHPLYQTFAVFDLTGKNVGWGNLSTPAEPRVDISGRDYFRHVLGTNTPAVSSVRALQRPPGAWGITAMVPVRDANDEVIGAAAVVMELSDLSRHYEEGRLRAGQAIFLTDRREQLAFHTDKRRLSHEDRIVFRNSDAVRNALAGGSNLVTQFMDPLTNTQRIGAVVSTRKYHWAVGVTVSEQVALGPVRQALVRDLLVFTGCVAVGLALAWFVAEGITGPVSRLRTLARALGSGDLSRRADIRTGDEIEELGSSINEMASELQLRDARLRESEERFRATFEQAAVGIAHVSPDGRWIRVNRRLCEIVGYSPEELASLNFKDITHPEDLDRDLQEAGKLIRGEVQTYSIEKRYIRKDGSFVWVNLTGSLTRNPDSTPAYFIGVVEDISSRKQIEEERTGLLESEKTARAAAEAANKAKDHFLAIVSHELRTPLTPVLAAVSLLKRDTRLPEDVIEDVQMIEQNINSEARLIEDLLELTRIRQPNFRIQKAPVDVHDIIELVLHYCDHNLRQKNIQVRFDRKAGRSVVEGDEMRIQQVFWNLVNNAVKFSPASGALTIRTHNPEPDLIRVEVTDSGIGIEPDLMDRLFTAFEQGEQTVTRRYGGLGLGLAISRALVAAHGGAIQARSDGVGKGATFTVELPVTPEVTSHGGSPASTSGSIARPLRILLVEDNQQTANSISKLLVSSGHAVETAGTASAALDLAKADQFDLLISDIGLPDATGWDLLGKLRKKQHHMRAVALSGFSAPEDEQRSRDAGFMCHVKKPVNMEQLEAILRDSV